MQTEDNKERDLLSELDKATEKKEPSANNVKSWNFGDDDEAKNEATEQTQQADTTEQELAKAGNNPGGLTERQMRNNAIASAAGVSLLTELLCEGIISMRYHFKIDSEKRELLDERLLDTDYNTLNDQEKFLVNKYNRLKKECNEKLAKISKSTKNRERMEEAFYEYSRSTGKVFLTPQSRLWISIGEDVIKSTMAAMLM